MKSKHPEIHQRYMLLFKIDAYNLFRRIKERQQEYIEIFSLKRTRAVFRDIFENRYFKASAFDLSHCAQEVIEALDQFYTAVDQLYWYLKHTQDMPKTIEDEVARKVTRLEKFYHQLSLFVDAELSGSQAVEEIDQFESIPSDDFHEDSFLLDGERSENEAELDLIQPEEYADPDEFDQEEKEDEN